MMYFNDGNSKSLNGNCKAHYKRLAKLSILLLIFFIVSFRSTGQVGSGIAPVNIPTGGFHIEGNLQANIPTPGVGDWLPGAAGSGGSILNANGTPVVTTTTFHLTDAYSAAENNFDGGKKFNDNPNGWTWTTNPALAKCDINNAMFHFTNSIVAGKTHTWVIVAADRRSNSGSAYIDFEFYQNTLTVNNNGTFSSAGPNGGRTNGDLLLTLALTNGGGTAEFFVNRWQNIGGATYDYVDRTSVTPAGAVLAATNAASVPVSFPAFGGNTYGANLFVEAAIDLTALFGALDPCTSLGVKTLFVKTKTSPSPSATIVDFITPQQVQLQLGLANAGPSQSQCSNVFSVTGAATPSPGDAVANTTWSVESGAANIASPSAAATSITVTGSPAILRYTVKTTFGCTVSDTLILTVLPPPTANAGSDATINCTTTSTQLSASGGVSYAWSPSTGLSAANIANPVATPVATTEYTVTVTGANGCTATDKVTVTVDKATPAANAGNDATINCTTISTQLSASGGGSYSWSPAAGLSATNIANPGSAPAATTEYTVTVTGANGCTATDKVTVTVDKATPAANAGNDATINCSATSAQLSASGGVSYSWSPAAGLNTTNIANPVATPAATTEYTVTVTGANGCTATDKVTVTVDKATPTANAGSDVTINCFTTSIQLSASGGVSYSWSPATGLSATNIANPDATPAATTEYTVTVTGANGCTATDKVTVTVDKATPAANAGNDVTINCTTTSAQLSASGGVSYSWLPAAGLSATNIANPVATPVTTTTYTVMVTAANGCTATDAVKVTVDNTLPAANAGSDVTLTCAVTSTQLLATGGVAYAWSPAAGLSATSIANPVASPASTTTYTVTVTGANGCAKSDDVTVSVDATAPDAPVICVVQPSLCGPVTGSVTIISPIGPDYVYSINNGTTWQASTSFPNLNPGSVTGVKVKKLSTGCVSAAADCDASNCTSFSVRTQNTSAKSLVPATDLLAKETTVKAFPNPFNDRVKFVVNVAKTGNGILEVYNMLGQKIQVVYQGYLKAGVNNFELSLPNKMQSNLVYKFSMDGKTLTGKLIQLK